MTQNFSSFDSIRRHDLAWPEFTKVTVAHTNNRAGHLMVPMPCDGVDWLAHCTENPEAAAVMLRYPRVARPHERPDERRRSV